ncbi:MAG: AbrB/MazE/SpoVT family DNA-binding domain-containing protein [Defluviitaleaceae bacterium]|nr:AbrB/MazE/SpoVT family DNA-binding domain-containing protein [Defluviitaleaceae bacterium]
MKLKAIRTLDIFGRLKIPLKLRQELGWDNEDTIEYYVKDGDIILRLSKDIKPQFGCYLNKAKKEYANCDFCGYCTSTAMTFDSCGTAAPPP